CPSENRLERSSVLSQDTSEIWINASIALSPSKGRETNTPKEATLRTVTVTLSPTLRCLSFSEIFFTRDSFLGKYNFLCFSIKFYNNNLNGLTNKLLRRTS